MIYPVLDVVSNSVFFFLLDLPAMGNPNYLVNRGITLLSCFFILEMPQSSNCREAKDVTLYDKSQEIKGPVVVTRTVSH